MADRSWRSVLGTPLVHDGIVYVCTDNGNPERVRRAQAANGCTQQRVSAEAGGFSASPIAAGDRIYLASEKGMSSSCRPAVSSSCSHQPDG